MPSDPLQDDRGNSFPEEHLAPLPPDLAQSITKRPLNEAHVLLLFGLFSFVVSYVGWPALPAFHDNPLKFVKFGIFVLLGLASSLTALACYAGLGPSPRTDRRLLLKQALCPVCLQPLDKRQRGETINCRCGATWERRYM